MRRFPVPGRQGAWRVVGGRPESHDAVSAMQREYEYGIDRAA